MRPSLSIVLLACLTAACASPEPFVDHGNTISVDKPELMSSTGTFSVCFSDKTPEAEILAVAGEQCAALGLQALPIKTYRWNCRATSPHNTLFRCVDPNVRHPRGGYVNVFDKREVEQWEKRTGKKAPRPGVRSGGPQVVVPPAPGPVDPSAPAAPPPAPVAGTVLTPEAIAGRPALPASPLPLDAPPPPAPLPSDSSFTLPPGSWADHFEE